MRPIRVGFYYQQDLNLISGASIWIQSVAETLRVNERVHITLLQRAPEKRDLISGPIRSMERIEVVDPADDRRTNAKRLTTDEALDVLERLDDERHFDIILLRSYEICLAAAARPALRGRLWSAYVLEPERDITSADYIKDLTVIAEASRYVITQTEEMRELLERLVPAARGKTILLPPSMPPRSDTRPTAGRPPLRRMVYAGKFAPFYAIHRLVDFLGELRRDDPDLEFHVAGERFAKSPDWPDYPAFLKAMLETAPGVVQRGGMTREQVLSFFEEGGIGINLWDYAHGERMYDLVIAMKVLDYCTAGLPVILNKASAHGRVLGEDYPLFVSDTDAALPALRRVLDDPDLYEEAAERCWHASRLFTHPAVYARLAPYIEGTVTE